MLEKGAVAETLWIASKSWGVGVLDSEHLLTPYTPFPFTNRRSIVAPEDTWSDCRVFEPRSRHTSQTRIMRQLLPSARILARLV